jgi:flagellar M-ring protein FliF
MATTAEATAGALANPMNAGTALAAGLPAAAQAAGGLAPLSPAAGLPVALPRVGALASLGGLGTVLAQPAVRKALPAIIALAVVVLFAGFWFWMQEVPYRPVFPGMGEADQQAALETLKAAQFNPRIDPASGQLTVPVSRYHEARILLSSQGLPKAQNRGILDSLKDQSAMTTSQFMEQARYVAATEQELARSIGQIGSIQSARVHLAQTRQSAFVRDRTPVKASVIVTPYSGMQITPNQVQAIVHLVASSIPYLNASEVTVVDNLGNLISKSATDNALGLTTLQIQHKQQAEETYRNRIIQLLEPVVGEGNVRAQVDLVMDFTQVETASEDYDSRKTGPRTRSEALTEERATTAEASGIPGALSNIVPPDSTPTREINGTQESTSNSQGTVTTKSTRNYEMDRQVRHVRNAQGAISRVSAAVVIRNRSAVARDGSDGEAAGFSADEVKRFTELVQGVVGYSQERGDVVTLVPARFEPGSAGPSLAWYENDLLLNILKAVLACVVLVVILLTVVRPIVRSYLPAPVLAAATGGAGGVARLGVGGVAGTAAGAGGAGGEGSAGDDGELDGAGDEDDGELRMREGESIDDFKARLKAATAPKKTSITGDMLDVANTYDDKVALVRMLVREDSGRVATVLKNLIKNDLAL